MDITTAIASVIERRDLTAEEMQTVMRAIMTGQATPAQIGGFLVGLRMKGETVAEIAAGRWRSGDDHPAPPSPLYLRPPDATPPKDGGRLRPAR